MKINFDYFWVTILGISTFIAVPALIFQIELLWYSFVLYFSAFIGFRFAKKFQLKPLIFFISSKLMIIITIFFVGFELLTGFQDLIAPSIDVVKDYLDYRTVLSSKNIVEILQNIIRSLFIISALVYSKNNKLGACILIIFFGMLTSGISRSAFLMYLAIAIVPFLKFRVNIKLILGMIFLILIFFILSELRGDNEGSYLGGPVVTAIAFPIINLGLLADSGLHGSALDYFIQLIIKPLPGFLFEPFGSKPIFSFNVALTEELNSSTISSGLSISVYTAAGALVYYEPIILTVLIIIIIYLIIGLYFEYIRGLYLVSFYSLISLFLLHRSNLLDMVSLIIINFVIILFLRFLTKNIFKIKNEI